MTTLRKTKRKLTNIDFSSETSHIALVSPEIGGPANGADYALVLKANKFSKEAIEKMQQVQVTMELPDFLRKFFGVYYEDAEVLARLLGYVEPEDDTTVEPDDWYENYIQSKVDSFTILKSLNESKNITDVLSVLDEKQYLAILNDQVLIEKALAKKESELVAKASESDNSTHASVEKSVEVSTSEKTKSKEKHMTKPVTTEATVEMVEKSVLVDLQKSLEDKSVELQKALDSIAVFQKEKQEQITKSKTAQFTAVVKDEKLVAPIVKAALALESDEDFTAFLGAITSMQVAVEKSKETLEKSDLFQEKGASVSEDEKPQESALARVLKAKQAKQ
jgi:flagellar biosynthesis regulator FlaF